MSEAKQPPHKNIFWLLSWCQILMLLAAFTAGFVKFGLIEKGGAYGISAFIFMVLYLPSLLLLIPDVLFLIFSRKLSRGWRFFGYFFHTVAFSWSFFLVAFALKN